MFLHHYCLNQNELNQLDEIMTLINKEAKGTIIQGIFRDELRAFMQANEIPDEVFGKHANRFLTAEKIATREYRGVVVVYDFLASHFVRLHYLNDISDETLKIRIEHLRELIQELKILRGEAFKRQPNPLVNLLGIMDLDKQTGTANESVFNEYVGYRRSSNKGDIIRFYLKIQRTQLNKTISFENRYRRGTDNWRVDGFGYVVHDVYYLVGHCQNDEGVSRGMRMMALRHHLTDDLLYGVLTSMDKRDPICCRIVLLPYDGHHFPERNSMRKEAHVERILYRNGSDNYKSFTEEIDRSLAPLTRRDPDLLYRYICNANLSVIRADPKYDRSLIDLELAFRKKYFNKFDGNLKGLKDRYIKIMSTALEAEIND